MVTIPVSDPALILELLLAVMSLQSVAALLKLANIDDPRKERSSARTVDAAVTMCLLSSDCCITSEGRGGVGCLARLGTDGVCWHWAPLLLSQSKYCVLLMMLNRRTYFGSSRRMEAEGENWEKGDTHLELVMPLCPCCCPSAFSASPERLIVALYSKCAADMKYHNGLVCD